MVGYECEGPACLECTNFLSTFFPLPLFNTSGTLACMPTAAHLPNPPMTLFPLFRHAGSCMPSSQCHFPCCQPQCSHTPVSVTTLLPTPAASLGMAKRRCSASSFCHQHCCEKVLIFWLYPPCSDLGLEPLSCSWCAARSLSQQPGSRTGPTRSGRRQRPVGPALPSGGAGAPT
jgi:hypothetical protein